VRPDVTLGGGSKTFTETAVAGPWAGQTLFEQASDRGYQLVDDAASLDAVTAADATAPVLGLFTEGNFPTRWVGPEATIGGGALPAVSCTENPERLNTGLSLGSLTSKAIDLLNTDDQGFFLQVEGASIDKRDHAADACGQIGETVDLDEAVQEALEFAKAGGNTLVVVTADHAHTSQILGSTPPGLSAHLLTEEGQPMIVGYGTAEAGGSQQHTGSQVRIAGYGPGAANVVGFTDQTDLFFTSANSLSLNRDLTSLSADATLSLSASAVEPGAEFTASVSGLDADWQVRGLVKSDPVDLGQADVLRGDASFTTTAPTELGEHTVTLTGAQTGTVLNATLVVAENPAAVPAPTTPADPAAGAAAGGTGSNGSGVLGATGAVVAPLAALAALLMAGGTMLALRHRRGQLPLV
jgi:alkaline phosphatase